MKIVIINGQNHKGTTEMIARQLAEKVGGPVREFFLPRDFGSFCTGCWRCFRESMDKCPHYEKLSPITEAMDEADLIILASPVYVYHATGQMMAFLDHYGSRWVLHKPVPSMFRKQGAVIATAAGAGQKSACRDMADSLMFWGVPKIHRIAVAVHASSLSELSPKTRAAIDRKTTAAARKIRSAGTPKHPSLKGGFYFAVARMLNRKGKLDKTDNEYWRSQGWTGKKRPWRE